MTTNVASSGLYKHVTWFFSFQVEGLEYKYTFQGSNIPKANCDLNSLGEIVGKETGSRKNKKTFSLAHI